MSDIKDWTIEMCVEWLEDPYNEPCRETDDSFDRAYRSEVKKRLINLYKQDNYYTLKLREDESNDRK